MNEHPVEFIYRNFYPRMKQFQWYSIIIWKIEFIHKISMECSSTSLEMEKINDHEPQCSFSSHDTIDLKTRAPVYSILNTHARRS